MWVDRLVSEYSEGKEELEEMRELLTDSELDQLDKTQINGMIRDMVFGINWMKIGREPDSLRGIDRRSVYQRRVLMDMDLFPSLEIVPEPEELSNEDKRAIVEILVKLSVRERQCFVLHNAYRMSMSDIADELGVSKGTVQSYLKRANKKIKPYDSLTVAN